ncbi:MAG: type III-A CRISPR-associated RAMP protein Csm5 [Spirochaetota bacterium]|nr:type III-A CRISPR-associated RAMP protein Csm5 [Spirochaetota bacterium]
MKNYNSEIRIITPLIIHNGDTYNPLELLSFKENRVSVIRSDKIFSVMYENTRNKFFEAVDSMTGREDKDRERSMQARSLIKDTALGNPDLIEYNADALPGFTSELNSNPYANVNMIFKNEIDGMPYIPGSTVKGAIRTALLESLSKQNNIDDQGTYKSSELEMRIMKNDPNAKYQVSDDPFKFLKVSDFTVGSDEKIDIIFGTIRVIGKNKQQKGIPVYTEMTDAECLSMNKYYTLKGSLSIDDEGLRRFTSERGISEFISIANIIESLKDFYTPILENDKHPIKKDIISMATKRSNGNSSPVRLGRFAQIESKTFKHSISDKRKRFRNTYGGVSRAVISGDNPAGWCVFSIVD